MAINKLKRGVALWTLRGKTNKDSNIVRAVDVNKVIDEANLDITDLQSQIDSINPAVSKPDKEVFLNSLQCRQLFSSPQELLPALPVNQYYSDVKLIVEMTTGTVSFNTGDKHLYVYWEPDWTTQMSVVTDNFFWGTGKKKVAENSSSMGYYSLDANTTSAWQDVGTTGRLAIGTFGADSTVGDGSMLVKIWYNVKTVGTEL